jgi:transcriptional regulator with XRE-family HTH domain|nr:MAG TPA: Helix-turn-helix XRE-family like protein [Caudoviricetes sp.]DAJ16219.1 MAG TPA: Helix-turn-helix XRE-family like protein [Podoviridae sp. ct13o21]DAP50322.1 MAG TPA: Helix-turn-helix XRE-family like protein [Caudoviricetes sp.]
MPFTQNFNYCMEQKKYTAYKFAKIIGASNQGVLNWQSGECIPYPKTRQKIADHFGITLAELDGDDLPVLPPQGAKKAPDPKTEGVKKAPATEGEGYTELQKAGIQFVLSLPPEKLERFIKMGRAAFEEDQ